MTDEQAAGARAGDDGRSAGEQRTDFEASYAGTPPWDIGRPQPAFVTLAGAGVLGGRLLDVGCGTGEHVIMAAGLGLDATGVDIAPTAIAKAEAKAAERSVPARFLVADALDLGALGERFDTILDCGLFHIFDDDARARFVRSLGDAAAAGARYFMLCFSKNQPGDWGPRRVSEGEIRASLQDGWRVDSVTPSILHITFDPAGVQAWLVAATRL